MVFKVYKRITEASLRHTMFMLAAAFAFLAFSWAQTADNDVYLPFVTSIMAVITCVSIFAFALTKRLWLYRACGFLSTMTLATRSAQVVLNIFFSDVYIDAWYGWTSLALYFLLMSLLGRTWDRDVRVWAYTNTGDT
jgi:hypothetical protein